MKSIELTEEHKSKLLEMCKTLFPEYVDIFIGNYGLIRFVSQWEDLAINNKNLKENIPTVDYYVHWFEFCHEYLVDKILGDYNLIFCGPNRPHAVDYLYEQFKELKL